MSLTFPVDAKLKDGSPVQLVLADNQDIELLRDLYRVIVEEGTSYPHDQFPDEDAFMDYWFRSKSTVAAYVPDRAGAAGMVGRSTSSRMGRGGQHEVKEAVPFVLRRRVMRDAWRTMK